MDLKQEVKFLNEIYETYEDNSIYERYMRNYIYKLIFPFLDLQKNVLEFGCSDGYLTKMISEKVNSIDIVDASKKAIIDSKKHFDEKNNANFNESLFEDYNTSKKYDLVIASYILEHVISPEIILKKIAEFCHENTLIFIIVPNARALSRQISLNMNLIDSLYSLTANDLKHGHRRVFDRKSLNQLISNSVFENIYETGIILKLLADFQMDKMLNLQIINDSQIDALYKLGLEFPDLCGSIFTICKIKK